MSTCLAATRHRWQVAMLTRRFALFSSTVFACGVAPAFSQRSLWTQPVTSTRRGTSEDLTEDSAPETPLGPIGTPAQRAFIIDFVTGLPLLEKNADVAMPPSSMAKLMTMYLVYERLRQGAMTLNDELPVSERARRMSGSKMFVQRGSRAKVEDLIRGVIVQSANDACIVLVETIAGSEGDFVESMNGRPGKSD